MNLRKLGFMAVALVVCIGMLYWTAGELSESGDSPAELAYHELPESPSVEDTLSEAIFQRRSVRSFQEASPPLEVIADVLWASVGLTIDGVSGATRAAPSAGATDPLTVYLVANQLDSLEAGVYRYCPELHELAQVKEGAVGEAFASASLGQTALRDAPAVLVIGADHSRTTRRYGERGHRYVYMEAGHAAQNASLLLVSRGLGSVVIGAFSDDDVQRVLGMDPYVPLLLLPFGYER